MAVLLQTSPCVGNRPLPPLPQPQYPRDTKMKFLGSVKKKLHRKDSNHVSQNPTLEAAEPRNRSISSPAQPSSSSRANIQSNNPFPTTSEPTRRPDRPGMSAFRNPSNSPPPAYSPPAPTTLIPGPIQTTADDPYAFLSSFDTIFLIDDSGSMAGRSWRETAAALKTITPICTAHDADGIDLHFLNHPDNVGYKNITRTDTVEEIFNSVRPMGGTPTGIRLNQILRPYLRDVETAPDTTKPLNIIVITDGVASDDVESVIINAAKKLDKFDAPPWQVGIQFFQVGEERGAADVLAALDNELEELYGGIRDIVDTVPWSGVAGTTLNGDAILKVVLGAVNRRLDNKKNVL